jgi:hypothetical protein
MYVETKKYLLEEGLHLHFLSSNSLCRDVEVEACGGQTDSEACPKSIG